MKQKSSSLGHKILFVFSVVIYFTACQVKNDQVSLDDQMYNVNVWPSDGYNFLFAEDSLSLPSTGVCFSGGGTRAMVCAVGQMRGLYDLNLFDGIGYISCVSGGSWASVPFTYYTSGAASDEELLGTVIAPNKLTLDGMSSLAPGFLAGAANASLLDSILDDFKTTSYDELWIRGVSECYMAPFGVFNKDQDQYFSYDQATVDDIKRRNPSLENASFLTVHDREGDAKRPYLIVNSCIVGPYEQGPYQNPEQLAVFNYTPLYIGSAKQNTASYTPEGSSISAEHLIGGGFVEPFAFGSDTPAILPFLCEEGQTQQCINVVAANDTFSIADASGTSSSAFAADLTSHGIAGISLKDLAPEVNYFPVDSDSLVENINYMFGDGGNLENFGLISLLQRGVSNIVVFINTQSAVNVDFDTTNVATPKDIDSDLLPLFGISFSPTSDMNQNKVFSTESFNGIMQDFIDSKNAGQTVMATSQLTTVDNPWWGIRAGDEVNINWIYNENVDQWRDSLEWEIKAELDLGFAGEFKDFPRYRTVGENIALVQLTPKQINLLYQLSAWNVYTNKDAFTILQHGDNE